MTTMNIADIAPSTYTPRLRWEAKPYCPGEPAITNPDGSPCHGAEALFLVRRALTEAMGGAEFLRHGSRGEDLEQALRTLGSALDVCRGLVRAYQHGAEAEGMDWEDLDPVGALAAVVMGER